MRPSSALLERLSGLRLMGLTPGRSLRQGERRSLHKGPGLEFAGYRPYREGDDLRHIDARVYARLRAPYTREFLADRQMRVAILVDTSASMRLAEPLSSSLGKIDFAQKLTCLLSLAGLGSGDLVEIGMAYRNQMDWSQAVQGVTRADILWGFLEQERPETELSFAEQIRLAVPHLLHAHIVLLISDFWMEAIEQDLTPLGELSGHLYALHIISKQDESPLVSGQGQYALEDAETKAQIELMIDAQMIEDYARELSLYRASLEDQIKLRGAQLLRIECEITDDEMMTRLITSGLLA